MSAERPAAFTLHQAIGKLCRDAMDSTYAEVHKRTDDGEITVALQTIMRAADALDRIMDEEPALDVGILGRAYVEKQRDVARRALDGIYANV